MKSNTLLLLIALVALLVSSCAKIFYSPDAYTLAHSQKFIAIVPPTVSITAKKNVSAEAMKEQQNTESISIQKEIYSWMLQRKMQGKISQEIQDVVTTNAILKKAGYPGNPLTTAELCEATARMARIVACPNLEKQTRVTAKASRAAAIS